MVYVFALLLSILAGFIVSGVIYLAGSQNEGEAIFWGLTVSVILTAATAGYLWRRSNRQPTAPAPTSPPRIRARESNDWMMEGIDAPGDQPFIEAERSDRWSIKDSRIGGDDQPPPSREEEEAP